MKLTKIISIAFLAIAACSVSCTKDYDDDIKKINSKLATLDALMRQANSDISSLRTIVTAINAGDYITGVTKLDNDKGYTISFAKQAPITIYNGENKELAEDKTPIVGVAKDTDGKYYWTLTVGSTTSWIKTDEGDKIAATVSAPVMGVDADGYWTVDGQPVVDGDGNKIKAVSASFFNNVTVVDGSVLFELANGTVITLPFSPYTIEFEDGADLLVFAQRGESKTLAIKLSSNLVKSDFSAFSAEVKGKAGGDFDMVTRSAAEGWKVSVTGPEFDSEGKLASQPTVTIIAPTGLLSGSEPSAILTLNLLNSKGQLTTISRALNVANDGITLIHGGIRMQGYANLKDAVAQAQAGDVVELAEGNYPLTVDPTLANAGSDWYLRIDKENLTIKGIGNVVLYGETPTPNGSLATQSMLVVDASGFQLENVTVMPKPGTQINKVMEVRTGGNLLLKNCVFTPNSIVPGAPLNDAGSVMLNPGSAATGNFMIENCTFNHSQLFLFNCPIGLTVTAKGCTFNGQCNNTLYSKSNIVSGTDNWSTAPTTGATLNIQGCTFTNVPATPDASGVDAAIRASLGIFKLSGNTFPTNGCYWAAYRSAAISIVPVAEWQVGSYWIPDRTAPVGWTNDGESISFSNNTPTAVSFNKYYGKSSLVGMTDAAYWKVEAKLYVNPAQVGTKMRQSMWVNVLDASRTDVDWAIIEYSTDSGTPVWRVFDAFDLSGAGWFDVASASYATAGYHTLTIEYAGDKTMKYYVDGVVVKQYVNSDLSTATTLARSVFLQAYDTGEVYGSLWKSPVVSGR